MIQSDCLVLSGSASSTLKEKVCAYLQCSGGEIQLIKEPSTETKVEILGECRGKDVFVIQSTSSPANEHIMELLLITDALIRASAGRITAVIPYFGYARQERKSAPRTPITAKLVANLLQATGVNRVLSIDLHAAAVQGFFNIPLDHLPSFPVFLTALKEMNIQSPVVVAPDAGGLDRARILANLLGCHFAIVDKKRSAPGISSAMNVIGSVQGKTAILVDDICDTAGTFCAAATALKEKGAQTVIGVITHAVFSGEAISRISSSPIDLFLKTDTIEDKSESSNSNPKIKTLTVANLIGDAIQRIHHAQSLRILIEPVEKFRDANKASSEHSDSISSMFK